MSRGEREDEERAGCGQARFPCSVNPCKLELVPQSEDASFCSMTTYLSILDAFDSLAVRLADVSCNAWTLLPLVRVTRGAAFPTDHDHR
jgi:hypothetical protein